MYKVGIIGGGFLHSTSSTLWKSPKHFEWSKNKVEDVTFFIDNAIFDGLTMTNKRRFAWVVESRDVVPGLVERIQQNSKRISECYEALFSHNADIYNLEPNFHFLPSHATWIENPQIFEKSELVSMISSDKGWTAGHQHRLKWVQKLRGGLRLFGRGFDEVARKEDALARFCFSVCVENDSYKTYFSEKLLDCFCCGTIPIYYGALDVGEHFDERGIIRLTEDFQISDLTESLYWSKMDYVKENFKRATLWNTVEDLIWEKYMKK